MSDTLHQDPTARTVTLRAFKERIEDVRRTVIDPRAGVFGPASKLWEVNRHSIVFIAGGRAALLQNAHPFVAHGVDQHSVSLKDPIGRFNRTFAAVFAMVYGDLETALEAAHRTYQIHSRIFGEISEDVGAFKIGSPYKANDPEALFWVHATLWDSSVRVFEQFVRRLEDNEKEQYYQETKLFAYLFGIPNEIVPPTWADFLEYNERMWESDVLAVGRPAKIICHYILNPPNPALRAVMRWYDVVTGSQMPPRLRREYGLRGETPGDRKLYQRSVGALRAVENRLPYRLRYLPAYVAARRRIEGRTGRDPVGELLGRVFIGTPELR
jgi:uncharacterized protein (DUF2236 family)